MEAYLEKSNVRLARTPINSRTPTPKANLCIRIGELPGRQDSRLAAQLIR